MRNIQWVRRHGEELWERPVTNPESIYHYVDQTKVPELYPESEYEYARAGERPIDIEGRELQVGDRIAVAVTISRSANMRVGKVVKFTYPEPDPYSYTQTGKITCEWETSTHDTRVKKSSIQMDLPKYLKI